MTSSASSAAWLPAAIARAAVVPAYPSFPPTTTGGRHSAPDFENVLQAVATDMDVDTQGRHAEPDWRRKQFDPARDEGDAFDWLGFATQD
jgi:hypothetical protein